MIRVNNEFPNFIKYMGSKKEILDFIISGINDIHREGQAICDVFAGSATLSGALRGNNVHVVSNDIQQYSMILAETYLTNYDWDNYPDLIDIVNSAEDRIQRFHERFPEYSNTFNYPDGITLEEFKSVEKAQQQLLDYAKFDEFDNYYLFTKYYSGTYWNYEQCLWIDSIRCVADRYSNIRPLYVAILSSLMYAMAYNSQSTGHYAQYRDATSEKSMTDILIYRRKNVKDFFVRKFNEIRNCYNNNNNNNAFEISTSDYWTCLNNIEEGSLVYADPPYGLVHYSRFYHAIETLVRYDYPDVAYKGRYRNDRHQSPFCISSQVKQAFEHMFDVILERNLELVLSYSNSSTNTISLADLIVLACTRLNHITDESFIERIRQFVITEIEEQLAFDGLEILNGENIQVVNITNERFRSITSDDLIYTIKIKRVLHNHSTMGRREDRSRAVNEILILAERL